MRVCSIGGIHHVTAIAREPQRNHDFYTDVLGLRLVKRTVNFDDPGTYHLYFGDREGRPGTILTFFPWTGARGGRRGAGQATVTSFSVPSGALDFWRRRLASLGVEHQEIGIRFGEEVLSFADPDGLRLELVARSEAAEMPAWEDGPVRPENALRRIHGVTLSLAELEPSEALLTRVLGFHSPEREGARLRLVAGAGTEAARVDLLATPDGVPGQVAAGTVHHVAWRVPDDRSQALWRKKIAAEGLFVTPVQDRSYFRSIYFREPGGVLFEIATDPPGFILDEPVEELGGSLRLPPWLEPHRERIESDLPPLEVARRPLESEAAS